MERPLNTMFNRECTLKVDLNINILCVENSVNEDNLKNGIFIAVVL